jgi:hypothetical protein
MSQVKRLKGLKGAKVQRGSVHKPGARDSAPYATPFASVFLRFRIYHSSFLVGSPFSVDVDQFKFAVMGLFGKIYSKNIFLDKRE